MMKYRKRGVFQAVQWFAFGDHPKVKRFPEDEENVSKLKRERLGWIETEQGGYAVFPGDYIITDSKLRTYTCNPYSFGKLYEPIADITLPRGQVGKA